MTRLLFNGLALGIDGGMGVYTRRLLSALETRSPQREYAVLMPEPLARLADSVPAGRVILVSGRPPVRHSLASEIWWQQRLGRYAAEHHAQDVFVACTDFFAFRHPKRAFVVIHDGLAERRPADAQRPLSPRRIWRRCCLRWAARRATGVLTVSAWSASELSFLGRIPGEKIRVCHPWLDEAFLSPPSAAARAEARQTYRLPAKYWFYIGGFRNYKNVERMLIAYAQLARRTAVPPLVLGGSLPAAPAATRSLDVRACVAQLGLRDGQVVFTGPISNTLLPAVYAESALFIFPSMYEGFGYPPVEARGVGAPVIAARAASLPEVVGPQLCCFAPEAVDDMATAMERAGATPGAYQLPLDSYFGEKRGIERWLDAVDRPACPHESAIAAPA